MKPQEDDDRVESIPLPPIPMDAATRRWLTALSRGCDQKAAEIIGETLLMIRLDDEAAHATKH
jgi:hypothetical protein